MTGLRAAGYTVLPGAVDAGVRAELVERLAELEAAEGRPRGGRFEGRRTRRVHHLLAKGDVFGRLVLTAPILERVEAVLDRDCLVSAVASMAVEPGEVAQPLHADDAAIRLPKPHAVPLVVTAMVALDDFTAANGATRVLPGSHREPSPDWSDAEADAARRERSVPVELSAGDALLYVGSLWHGAGANSTSSDRRGIAVSYCAGWVRQQENQMLGLSRQLVATFPERLQRLCGYGLYNAHLGHVDRRPPGSLVGGPDDAWDPPLPEPLERWDT